ncbi:hypothetical protein THAOC_13282 [Thalassiosira oceanica]|uniref:Uncharacterized protein n=1 Tax=Thalassiosira oceanica TaxID=159749 RepID=K0T5Y0_THAOC|nr:hypothetical protein THAOC_13282 [Thalassiosira oceanica]|eukprot:EJK65822.1 hypothetical protein THAOC_13282 [Thalassiosira oceanica]
MIASQTFPGRSEARSVIPGPRALDRATFQTFQADRRARRSSHRLPTYLRLDGVEWWSKKVRRCGFVLPWMSGASIFLSQKKNRPHAMRGSHPITERQPGQHNRGFRDEAGGFEPVPTKKEETGQGLTEFVLESVRLGGSWWRLVVECSAGEIGRDTVPCPPPRRLTSLPARPTPTLPTRSRPSTAQGCRWREP